MSGNRIRRIEYAYFAGHMDPNEANDVADQVIEQPDRHLLSQAELLEAQGGMLTVALSVGLLGLGTLGIFAGSPKVLSHFRSGQLGAYEFACLFSSGIFWYSAGNVLGKTIWGDANRVRNHWLAYTWIKSQNRYYGPYVLHKAPMYY